VAFEPPVEAMSSAVYASWGRRFVAWLVDTIVVWGSIYAAATAAALALNDAVTGIAVLLLLGAFAPLYYAFLQAGKRGQTLGKRAFGIAVRNKNTLGRIGLGRALARAYTTWIFWLMFPVSLLDGLWPLWDAKDQTWHDKFAASVVVRI
jgi:uncharacterized RDD family membrane protein YckC